MSRKPNMTESVFNIVKAMLRGGCTNEYIMDNVEISRSTVQRIKRVDDWNEYKELIAFLNKQKPEEKPELPEDLPAEEPKVEQSII